MQVRIQVPEVAQRGVAVLRQRFDGKGEGPIAVPDLNQLRRLLPWGGQPVELTDDERQAVLLQRAADLLGVELRRDPRGRPLIRVAKPRDRWDGADSYERGFCLHMKPPRLGDALASRTPWLVFLNLHIPVDLKPFKMRLQWSLEMLSHEPGYHDLISNLHDLWLPRGGSVTQPEDSRVGLVWAPSYKSYDDSGGLTALWQGSVPSASDMGRIAWASLTNTTIPSAEVTPGVHPQLWGAPTSLNFEGNIYRIAGEGGVTAIWSVAPRLNQMDNLSTLSGVDVLTLIENEQGKFYYTMLVRARRQTLDELYDLENTLRTYGKVQRVPGWHPFGTNLQWAFQSFVPGGPLPPPIIRPSIRSGQLGEFLQILGQRIGATGSAAGDIAVGRFSLGRPALVKHGDNFAIGADGPPKAGKTTGVVGQFLQASPFGTFVQVSSVVGEAAPDWIEQALGGQVVSFRLPRAESPEEFQDLVQQDEQEIIQWVARMEGMWHDEGRPIGLPLMLRLNPEKRRLDERPPCVYRFLEFSRNFLRHESQAWGRWVETAKVPYTSWFAADDAKGAALTHKDPYIGDKAPEVTEAFREDIADFLSHGRKLHFCGAWVIFHDVQETKVWPKGSLGLFGLFLRYVKGQRLAHVFDPREMDIDESGPFELRKGYLFSVDTWLPSKVTDVIGRPEDRRSVFDEDGAGPPRHLLA